MSDFEQISVSFKSEAMRDFMACFTEQDKDIQERTHAQRAEILLTACRYLVDYCLEPRPPYDDVDDEAEADGCHDAEAKALVDEICQRFAGYELQVVVPMDLNGMTLALLVPSAQPAKDQLVHLLTHGHF